MNKIKHTLALLVCSLMSAFAQDTPEKPAEPEKPQLEKLAVYVYGANEAGINKFFGSKLLSAITQSGKYAEIKNSEAFHEELAAHYKGDIDQITQTAKQHGADFVCTVTMTEAFGAYSISARIIKTADAQTIRTASLERPIKSFDDIAKISDELTGQLLQLQPPISAPPPTTDTPNETAPPNTAPAAKKECANKFNINELVSKIQSGLTAQLKDCSATLAKNIALSKSPFGKKTELKEPKAFMTECTIDGIKQKLPSGTDEYVKPIESFIQNILNAASAADGLDVKKLSEAISGMNINDLINELKTKATNDNCVSDEPYAPPAALANNEEKSTPNDKEESMISLGFRGGLNFSHLSSGKSSYNSTIGSQFGLILDIALSELFHIQPSIMYIQKGAEDNNGIMTSHYIEIPLLLSLKFYVLRINAGPYLAMCLDANTPHSFFDFGLSPGLGFDIGKFYIGTFYDYGLTKFYEYNSPFGKYKLRNRTLGFNLGVNL